ncbi:hypothetical protein BDR26DRAFT_103488 [Obelidium mucronatum]|nr:hypothetical protein BDR26DRAFT_103488 [Obelidium mucronatum]
MSTKATAVESPTAPALPTTADAPATTETLQSPLPPATTAAPASPSPPPATTAPPPVPSPSPQQIIPTLAALPSPAATAEAPAPTSPGAAAANSGESPWPPPLPMPTQVLFETAEQESIESTTEAPPPARTTADHSFALNNTPPDSSLSYGVILALVCLSVLGIAIAVWLLKKWLLPTSDGFKRRRMKGLHLASGGDDDDEDLELAFISEVSPHKAAANTLARSKSSQSFAAVKSASSSATQLNLTPPGQLSTPLHYYDPLNPVIFDPATGQYFVHEQSVMAQFQYSLFQQQQLQPYQQFVGPNGEVIYPTMPIPRMNTEQDFLLQSHPSSDQEPLLQSSSFLTADQPEDQTLGGQSLHATNTL